MREQRGEKRLQRSISWLCAIVFVVFCFSFIAVYQSPLLEALYDKVATGKLIYNEYVVAVTVTTLLLLIALWLNRYAKFQREWTAMAYLPSSLLLAFITDIDASIYTGGKSLYPWALTLATGIIVYIISAFLLQKVLFAKIKNIHMEGNRILWRNLLLFTVLFCVTGALSNGNDNLKHEASAYSHYKRGDIDAALNVARRSTNASHELTAARAFYLSQQGKLGEALFEYPQYYGAEGLLPKLSQTSPLSPDTVYAAIGVQRKSGEDALAYLRRVIELDSVPSKKVADYYLCALLLEKKIEEFVSELPRFYQLAEDNYLPRHYKEALLYYSTVLKDYDLPFKSDTLRTKFLLLGMFGWKYDKELPQHYRDALRDYAIPAGGEELLLNMDTLKQEYQRMVKLEAEHPEYHVRSNYIRRYFGKTFWWYFIYGE